MPETTTSQDYITSDVLKDALGITGQTFADQSLASSITAASRMVDQLCNRFFYQDTGSTSRVYTPIRYDMLGIDDLVSASAVASDVDGTLSYAQAWTVNTDYILSPPNAPLISWPYTDLVINQTTGSQSLDPTMQFSMKITGIWGWPSVPQAVQEATAIIATQLFKRKREAPFGIVTFDSQAMRLGQVDAQVRTLLAPYRKHSVGIG